MRILSLYFGHDSSVCLLDNGQPVAVIEKERTTRRRHDQGRMDLAPLLEHHAWDPADIDLVVINPYVREDLDGRRPPAWDLTSPLYTERSDYLEPDLRCPPERRYSRHQIRLLERTYPCVAVDHHLGHIATGFYTSPFERATVLSADGGGDERTLAAARAEGGRILEIEYGWGITRAGREMNIGSVWGSVGQHHFNYGRLEAAGKLMGLAPFGTARPHLIEAIRHAAFANPYAPLPKGCIPNGTLDPKETFAQDVAASLQAFTTGAYLAAAERIAGQFGDDQLILTGGCSMNCVANTAVHTSGLYRDTFVPAQPSDCGLALGQALFAWHHLLEQPRTPRAWSPYLGTDAGTPEPAHIEAAGRPARAGQDRRHLRRPRGKRRPRPGTPQHPRRPSPARHPDPDQQRHQTARVVSTLAPMVLEEDFDAYFAPRVPSPYMSYTTTVTSPDLPAITHIDASTRPQVIARTDHGTPRALLEAWKRHTGLAVLLNTSLNCQEPIVDTPEQAEATWSRSGLDALITADALHLK